MINTNISFSQVNCNFLLFRNRKLEFVGEQSKRESIFVDKIESVQIVASESDQQGMFLFRN